MGGQPVALTGPDLTEGVLAADVPEGGKLLGHAAGEAVLLSRWQGEIFAVGATCTHYSGPLADGLVADGTIRCPWHHACFDLRTGAAQAPALDPIACWNVESRGDKLFVIGTRFTRAARTPPGHGALATGRMPRSVVILGGGAAGQAAAETLRAEGYAESITLVSADTSLPYDRPNVSKDYLAGSAPEAWMPLRGAKFYRDRRIEILLGTRAAGIDLARRTIALSDGRSLAFEALLIATGAEPNRLTIPGADLPHVHTLRTLADSRVVIAAAAGTRHAVVVGASFIGLEVAASLRARNVDVTVVSPEVRPMEKVLGREIGDFVRGLHEEHGVKFRMPGKPASIAPGVVTLESGDTLPADLVVTGVGVRPSVDLAERAGLSVDRGILVDPYLETSSSGVFAAGDVARYPDPRSGDLVRIEHWVTAQRQGRLAARNILGRRERIAIVPFFWSQHYDVPILYVGHAERWDEARVTGSVDAKDCRVDYLRDGQVVAVATIFRDVESLEAELAMERALSARPSVGGA